MDDDLFGTSLFGFSSFPQFSVLGDDYPFTSCLDFFRILRNEEVIYRVLLRLATAKGKHNLYDDTWTIRVGYTRLAQESGCSKRALGRAWPRLEALGFLIEREQHTDRRPSRYKLRSISVLNRLYKEAQVTHFRVMPNKSIQPFCSKIDSVLVVQ